MIKEIPVWATMKAEQLSRLRSVRARPALKHQPTLMRRAKQPSPLKQAILRVSADSGRFSVLRSLPVRAGLSRGLQPSANDADGATHCYRIIFPTSISARRTMQTEPRIVTESFS